MNLFKIVEPNKKIESNKLINNAGVVANLYKIIIIFFIQFNECSIKTFSDEHFNNFMFKSVLSNAYW
jgi:hypothetical protein